MARINIGSDVFSIPGLVNVDIRFSVKPNVVMCMKKLGFKDKIASEINLGNVIEHIPKEDLTASLAECKRILADDGVIYITIPLVDLAEESYTRGEITEYALQHIIKGEDEGYNSHKGEYHRGDIEILLLKNGFRTEPLPLDHFPYLVVSNILDPKPDPWQYGVKAYKL